jgi:hypothetical protein
VRVFVLAEPRVARLVEERQGDLGEVDLLDIEAAVAARLLEEPAVDVRALSALAGAGEDHL